ncbi:MAG: NAD(P)H-dependent oxidoreductase subunit E [Kiritimatiellia bacterium]
MNRQIKSRVQKICRLFNNDKARMMDIVRHVQQALGHVPLEAMEVIAHETSSSLVEVRSVVTFYHFCSERPQGSIVIRLCNDVIDEMYGADRVAEVLSRELGIEFGETTPDGLFTLVRVPCIGMSDQPPAALVNDVVVTQLDGEKTKDMIRELRRHRNPVRLVKTVGDGNNGHELVRAMVQNNIRQKGPVIFEPLSPGSALSKALALSPAEVIRDIKASRLRGRGGAGFPTGMKWDFTRQASGTKRYVLCNADEGEPGTFKDRVILTECPDLMFEGMTIAGYAIGATEAILYLRAEYAYLYAFLEHVLAQRRKQKLLGKNILGREGFDFDIRIQLGAGAYVCGEETALISSCEGQRGDPKNRPPFPAQKGYLGCPTTVNNAETFCCVARILEKGAGWFAELGSKASTGTKLLSISGDCRQPGVYEVPFGIKLSAVLKLAAAERPQAVQVGGPSGQMVGPEAFDRTICYDDLATGGSIMIFGPQRNVVEIVRRFLDFFTEESCGYCTPCRVGNVLLRRKLDEILDGRGTDADLNYLTELSRTIKTMSRCGLGQTSPNPVLNSIERFRSSYEKLFCKRKEALFLPSFDLEVAQREAQAITGQKPKISQQH